MPQDTEVRGYLQEAVFSFYPVDTNTGCQTQKKKCVSSLSESASPRLKCLVLEPICFQASVTKKMKKTTHYVIKQKELMKQLFNICNQSVRKVKKMMKMRLRKRNHTNLRIFLTRVGFSSDIFFYNSSFSELSETSSNKMLSTNNIFLTFLKRHGNQNSQKTLQCQIVFHNMCSQEKDVCQYFTFESSTLALTSTLLHMVSQFT